MKTTRGDTRTKKNYFGLGNKLIIIIVDINYGWFYNKLHLVVLVVVGVVNSTISCCNFKRASSITY